MVDGPTTQAYQVVERYGSGMFRISGQTYTSSVLVFPEQTVEWPVASFADVDECAFAHILEGAAQSGGIELLLLGCGPRMELVTLGLRTPLRTAGIVIEPMDTGAAARTFNLLLSEDRQVAAALLALP